MFVTPAHAQNAGTAAPGSDSGFATFMTGSGGFLMQMGLLFIIFYFLLIRPQQKRARAHQATLAAVKRNDTVITSGGLIGKVTKVDESEVEVELAPNVRVRVVKGMLSEVRQPGGKPAND